MNVPSSPPPGISKQTSQTVLACSCPRAVPGPAHKLQCQQSRQRWASVLPGKQTEDRRMDGLTHTCPIPFLTKDPWIGRADPWAVLSEGCVSLLEGRTDPSSQADCMCPCVHTCWWCINLHSVCPQPHDLCDICTKDTRAL